tara:strand:- start:2895 stop:3443 length:549 start_codon:yes stop_codon:yes gene_type:complete
MKYKIDTDKIYSESELISLWEKQGKVRTPRVESKWLSPLAAKTLTGAIIAQDEKGNVLAHTGWIDLEDNLVLTGGVFVPVSNERKGLGTALLHARDKLFEDKGVLSVTTNPSPFWIAKVSKLYPLVKKLTSIPEKYREQVKDALKHYKGIKRKDGTIVNAKVFYRPPKNKPMKKAWSIIKKE